MAVSVTAAVVVFVLQDALVAFMPLALEVAAIDLTLVPLVASL